MSTHFKPHDEHGEYGVNYIFDRTGDGIRMHSHIDPSTWHETRVLKGSIECYGDELDTVVKAGDTLAFKSYRLHELAALEDGTEIVNVFLFGKPAGYIGTPLDTLSGSSTQVLMGRLSFS